MYRAIVVVLLVALAAALALTLRRRSDCAVTSAPLGMLMIIAIAMMGAALARRYPFGGFLRQQFILFPFAMLAAFALVDEVVARRGAQRFVAALWVAVMLNALVQRSLLRFFPGEPGSRESAQFHRFLDDSHAVYVDKFSLVPFFAAHQRDTWSAQTELGEGFVALPVRQGERSLVVLRDLTRWSADLSDPRLYRDLRRLLERTELPSIDLFHMRRGRASAADAPSPRASAGGGIHRPGGAQRSRARRAPRLRRIPRVRPAAAQRPRRALTRGGARASVPAGSAEPTRSALQLRRAARGGGHGGPRSARVGISAHA